MNWIINPLKNYAGFSERARRAEFWTFLAFATTLQLAARYIDEWRQAETIAAGMGIFELCVTLTLLLPTVAVVVRRLHDSGRSGFWLFLGYGPLALINLPMAVDQSMSLVLSGAVIMGVGALFIILLLPGNGNQNRYGADPRRR